MSTSDDSDNDELGLLLTALNPHKRRRSVFDSDSDDDCDFLNHCTATGRHLHWHECEAEWGSVVLESERTPTPRSSVIDSPRSASLSDNVSRHGDTTSSRSGVIDSPRSPSLSDNRSPSLSDNGSRLSDTASPRSIVIDSPRSPTLSDNGSRHNDTTSPRTPQSTRSSDVDAPLDPLADYECYPRSARCPLRAKLKVSDGVFVWSQVRVYPHSELTEI